MTAEIRKRLYLLPVLIAVLLAACQPAEPPLIERRFIALGTIIDISLYGIDAERADPVLAAIERDFHRLHHDWHAWEESRLTTLNTTLQQGKRAPVPAGLAAVLEQARGLNRSSGGLFEPAIGGLMALWGFHGNDLPGKVPEADAIAAWLAERPRMNDLELEGGHARSTNPRLQLDLGAFAKGVAVDRAIDRLRDAGIGNAIVNAGGDLRAIGARERPWRIGIRHPRAPGVLASIETQGDESIFTSGDYERYFEAEGKRYHHIIDPRNGYPARGTASLTVIHSEAAVADAAATALFVAGDAWPQTAADMGIERVMRVRPDGTVELSPAMAERIRFETDIEPEVTLRGLP
ncbi:FAD:protein FMN transferase [Thiohalobacter thiocyanaticus]|uniref:FAD:protein FMN transferase n=1 Tax=Thiohalobacter thiocyanaticus TaxID=585455 RepID=A0A426QKC5_9GAMM|nr:FAD:protein FMN transferase [Thiohalobacter thiocyanaticus]RRQ22198.1 FAD:protein FMN transferase [Thiohalobacter thiocyanaticus]